MPASLSVRVFHLKIIAWILLKYETDLIILEATKIM